MASTPFASVTAGLTQMASQTDWVAMFTQHWKLYVLVAAFVLVRGWLGEMAEPAGSGNPGGETDEQMWARARRNEANARIHEDALEEDSGRWVTYGHGWERSPVDLMGDGGGGEAES